MTNDEKRRMFPVTEAVRAIFRNHDAVNTPELERALLDYFHVKIVAEPQAPRPDEITGVNLHALYPSLADREEVEKFRTVDQDRLINALYRPETDHHDH